MAARIFARALLVLALACAGPSALQAQDRFAARGITPKPVRGAQAGARQDEASAGADAEASGRIEPEQPDGSAEADAADRLARAKAGAEAQARTDSEAGAKQGLHAAYAVSDTGFGIHAYNDAIALKPMDPIETEQASAAVSGYRRLLTGDQADHLRHLIGYAEAGRRGYDAIHYSASLLPAELPTRMTLGDILGWIQATPGQNHAIGRYQFIPSTLRDLIARAGLTEDVVFSPEVQDQLAEYLLLDAGYNQFVSGALEQTAFMNNLAAIWAGLPNSSGKSHYHGYAGNRATITWAVFESEVSRIFGG